MAGGIFSYIGDKVKNEEETAKKQAVASAVDPRQLPGVPQNLEPTLEAAQKLGAVGLRNWLKAYDRMIQDPRRAWIELDYCVLVAGRTPRKPGVFCFGQERTLPLRRCFHGSSSSKIRINNFFAGHA